MPIKNRVEKANVSKADAEALVESVAELHEMFLELSEGSVARLNADSTLRGMVDAIVNKLDLSKARESKDDTDLLAALARRIGEAYGTFFKLNQAARRAVDEGVKQQAVHDIVSTCDAASNSFKKVITDTAPMRG